MEKNTEKQPIDDLFARKLSNMSLSPSADGFERLQARMGQQKPEARIVFWRNPALQRYMAAAACLLLVCLFGWLYWPSTQNPVSEGAKLATNRTNYKPMNGPKEKKADQVTEKAYSEVPALVPADVIQSEQLAQANKASEKIVQPTRASEQSADFHKHAHHQPDHAANTSVLAQTKPTEAEIGQSTPLAAEAKPATVATLQVADNMPTTKSNPPAERVLVVTIEEPATLVAARQVAKEAVEEKTLAVANDKPEKEVKAGLWQQVKRFKQGDIFARRDNAANDDQGLLGRAYNGLKHSLEKDKSSKQ
ncbi:hypothetical protein [Spirosoma koreense]